LFVVTAAWLHGFTAAAEPAPVWMVVGREGLVKPLEPLVRLRRSQGLETVVSTGAVGEALAAAPRRPKFLLLVGDDQPGKPGEPWYVAARRAELYRWRAVQRKEFASDAAWGDLDGDRVPEIAVGRIPARTPEQVAVAVKKILAFERKPPSIDDLRLPIWGGSAEYSPAIDAMATQMLLGTVQAEGPRWASPWVVTGNPRHPLCGWPPDQPELFSRQLRQGGVAAVLLGHANAESFFSMSFQQRRIWYTAALAEPAMANGPPAPPTWFFSCESGDFTRPEPCMAESLLWMPGGPVATIAATTESHPLTNYFSSLCLLKELGGPPRRLGTLWLAAQRRAKDTTDFLAERVLRDVEGKLEATIDVEKLRRDQMLMYALLGDPATRLRLPLPLQASIERTDSGWRWKVQRPEGAQRLEVGFRAKQKTTVRWQEVPSDPEKARAAFHAANARLAFTALPAPAEGEPWEGTIDVNEPGWLRLVAVSKETIHVVVFPTRQASSENTP